MSCEDKTCRIRVKWPRHKVPVRYDIRRLREIKGTPQLTKELRGKWAEGIKKLFSTDPNAPTSATIRPWDILLYDDGSVGTLTSEKGGRGGSYPSRLRIPPQTVLGLDDGERVIRAENFALGSLLYELVTATEPFEGLSDDEVQDRYSCGIFPDDVFAMTEGHVILACWSLEFREEMVRLVAETSQASTTDQFRAYAKAHPYILTTQIVSGVVVTASVAAPLALGAFGFGAMGPVAGSMVTSFQSYYGFVQAGSLFSWCQSAAMGGAAVNGIYASGAVGGGMFLAATGAAAAGRKVLLTPEQRKEIFLTVYRKENSGAELMKAADQSKIRGLDNEPIGGMADGALQY